MTRITTAPARSSRAALFALFTICIALPSSGLTQEQPTPTDGMVLPDASVTTRDDATSLELNPAGLGYMHTGELAFGMQWAEDDREGLETEGGGLFLAGGTGRLGGGFGVQWLDRPDLTEQQSEYRKYTLGAAISTDLNLSFGAAYNFFGSGDSKQIDELSSWDAGVQWRPSENVGFGFHARDINRPFLDEDGEALPIRTAIGAALRFFDGRALLDSTASFTTDGDSMELTPRVLIEPIDGLRIFGRSDFDFQFEDEQSTASWARTIVGLALNTTSLGIEGATHIDHGGADDIAGYSGLAWLSDGKRRSAARPTDQWVLIDLTGGIDEQPVSRVFGTSTQSFMSLMVDLENMADDPDIAGVVFNVGESDLGYGQIWEVRRAIERLRAANKQTVSMLTNPTYRETYLASAAEHLWLLPAEPYAPTGLNLKVTSYAEALANAGIRAEFLRIGQYKSAPESYTYKEPSPESLEQTERYLDGLYTRTVGALADDRGLSVERVEEMVDNVPLHPVEAIEKGFVDETVYLDYIEQQLEEKFGVGASLSRGYDDETPAEMRWGVSPEIAVVVIEGAIVRGRSGSTPIVDQVLTGSDTLTRIFDRLRRAPNVAAVVVRVDSPGGSAVGSDLIYRAMRRLAEEKPVVASMGNVAASGGYYVAAGADEIYASPNTLTGSIGIFAGKFSISRLAEFIGINSTELKRGDKSGAFNLYRPWSEEERDGVSQMITYLYKLFIQQVARTRPLTAEEVDAVGRGRIWDGASAEEQKLVDHLGGTIDAIHRAEALSGLEPGVANYKLYPDTLELFDLGPMASSEGVLAKLFGAQNATAQLSGRSALAGLVRRIGKAILLPALFEDGEALMLLPHVIELD